MALNRGGNRTRCALVDRKTTERDFLIGMREFPPGDSQFVPKQFIELGKRANARRGEALRGLERREVWISSGWRDIPSAAGERDKTRANDSKTMQLFAITASVRGSRNYPILFPLLVPTSLGLSLRFIHPLNFPFLSIYLSLSLSSLAPRR